MNSYADKYSRVIVIAGIFLFLASFINGFAASSDDLRAGTPAPSSARLK